MKDTYGREITYMRLSVTELCNLRCKYCMPEEGISKKAHREILTEEEMILAVKAAASLGVRKLRITGGEPLVKRNILSICQHAGQVDGIEEMCITTNGILLPEMAEDLKKAGISRINLSLDTLNPEKYAAITRIGSLEDALRGLDAALETGFEKIKINTVLIKGFNDDEIESLAALTQQMPVDVRFIELMPMPGNGELSGAAYISCDDAVKKIEGAMPQSQRDGVATMYRLPHAQGNIGLISPISSHFCGECNRIRLTADGKLKPCLHSDAEYSIKGMDYDQMRAQIRAAILGKPIRHPVLVPGRLAEDGRAMNRIGG